MIIVCFIIKRKIEGCHNSNCKVIKLSETYTINSTSIDSAEKVANSVHRTQIFR